MVLLIKDLHGAWDPFLGHHAALHARKDENEFQSKLNVEWVVDYWLSKGAEANKILLGLGLYGRSFTLSQPGQNKLGDPAKGPSTAGTVLLLFAYFHVQNSEIKLMRNPKYLSIRELKAYLAIMKFAKNSKARAGL